MSARASSIVLPYVLSASGDTPSRSLPLPCPRHSCRSVCKSSHLSPYLSMKPTVALSSINSSLNPLPCAASLYAPIRLLMVTLLLPYLALIQSALGRLMPMAVDGYSSPPSMAARTTCAVTPFTFSFLKRGSTGEWSSNHWALSLMVFVRFVASISLYSTIPSQEPFSPRGSPYTSMKPLTKSISEECS